MVSWLETFIDSAGSEIRLISLDGTNRIVLLDAAVGRLQWPAKDIAQCPELTFYRSRFEYFDDLPAGRGHDGWNFESMRDFEEDGFSKRRDECCWSVNAKHWDGDVGDSEHTCWSDKRQQTSCSNWQTFNLLFSSTLSSYTQSLPATKFTIRQQSYRLSYIYIMASTTYSSVAQIPATNNATEDDKHAQQGLISYCPTVLGWQTPFQI